MGGLRRHRPRLLPWRPLAARGRRSPVDQTATEVGGAVRGDRRERCARRTRFAHMQEPRHPDFMYVVQFAPLPAQALDLEKRMVGHVLRLPHNVLGAGWHLELPRWGGPEMSPIVARLPRLASGRPSRPWPVGSGWSRSSATLPRSTPLWQSMRAASGGLPAGTPNLWCSTWARPWRHFATTKRSMQGRLRGSRRHLCRPARRRPCTVLSDACLKETTFWRCCVSGWRVGGGRPTGGGPRGCRHGAIGTPCERG